MNKSTNPFKKDKKQLSIFTTAGYPKLDSLSSQIKELEDNGVDFIEVGIPFSDPIADGPTIQRTSSIAIGNGMNLNVLFSQLNKIKPNVPLVLMGYLNPIINFGVEKFLVKCSTIGIQTVILPDLSVEIYLRDYEKLFLANKVNPVFLVTPKTEIERVKIIAQLCENSFVYLVSDNATTGNEAIKFDDQSQRFSRIKQHCGDTPVFIGFGIASKPDVDKVHELVDGAIIGSAYLKSVEKNEELEFIRKLLR